MVYGGHIGQSAEPDSEAEFAVDSPMSCDTEPALCIARITEV